MKKYLILISLLSTIFSCNTETTPQIKPSSNSLLKDVIPNNPKAQESNTPSVNKPSGNRTTSSSNSYVYIPIYVPIISPTPTPSPTEKPDFSKLDVYGEGIYCEDRNKIVKAGVVGVKLDKPVNIAVTKDGSAVYVVNGKCGRKPYLGDEFVSNFENDFCESRYKQDVDSDVVENNLIIKITKDGKKQAIIGDNTGVFFCSNDGVIALDENDNLYFSANRRIYKVKDDRYVELVANLDELEKENDSLYQSRRIGGLAVSNEAIYVDVRGDVEIPKRYIPSNKEATFCFGFCGEGIEKNTFGEIKRIKNNKLTNLFQTSNKGKSRFFLKNNLLYTLRATIKSKNFISFDKELFNQKLDLYLDTSYDYSSSGEVAQLNLDTRIWSSLHGYDYLSKIYHDLAIKNILINSKNELIYSIYNSVQKKSNESSKYPYFFVGTKGSYGEDRGYKDGKGDEALFNRPAGMAIDSNDNIYVADTGNNAIRKITPDGIVSTFYKE
jgi:hypothetical protein